MEVIMQREDQFILELIVEPLRSIRMQQPLPCRSCLFFFCHSFNSPHAAEITSQVSYAPSFQAPFAGEEAPPERSLFGRGVRLGQMLARQHCTWHNKFTLLAWAAQYATAHRVSYFCGGDVAPENWTAGSRKAYPSGSSSLPSQQT